MPEASFFYEILASFYQENTAEASALLKLCRPMWGQSYIAPVFSLLLHRWMLLQNEAGGKAERLKHINVLAQGVQYAPTGTSDPAAMGRRMKTTELICQPSPALTGFAFFLQGLGACSGAI